MQFSYVLLNDNYNSSTDIINRYHLPASQEVVKSLKQENRDSHRGTPRFKRRMMLFLKQYDPRCTPRRKM